MNFSHVIEQEIISDSTIMQTCIICKTICDTEKWRSSKCISWPSILYFDRFKSGWELRHSLKILKEAYIQGFFFPRKDLHFFFFFWGGRPTPPPKKKAYISLIQGEGWAPLATLNTPLDNKIDVFKKFTDIFRNGVSFERTKLRSFKDRFLYNLKCQTKSMSLLSDFIVFAYKIHTNLQNV